MHELNNDHNNHFKFGLRKDTGGQYKPTTSIGRCLQYSDSNERYPDPERNNEFFGVAYESRN